MSNFGFFASLKRLGIRHVIAPVGDRYVLAELHASGLSLGGEQSGHVVFPDEATTGDGLLTALHLLARMAVTGQPLAKLAAVVRRLPQVLLNVPVADRSRTAAAAAVLAAVQDAERELGDDGRVLLRPSGTEQIVRVMVEARTEQIAAAVAGRLAAVVAAS